MKHEILHRRQDGGPWKPVVAALQRISEQKVKVFRTFVPALENGEDDYNFVLLTTSKETHLGFGLFETRDELLSLCHLLESIFRQGGHTLNRVLLYKDMQKNDGWVVTMTRFEKTITFDFSPAH